MWRWLKIEITPPEFDRALDRVCGITAALFAVFLWVTGTGSSFGGTLMAMLATGSLFRAWRDRRNAREVEAATRAQETGRTLVRADCRDPFW